MRRTLIAYVVFPLYTTTGHCSLWTVIDDWGGYDGCTAVELTESEGSREQMTSNIALGFTVLRSLIWVCRRVCRNMWSFSMVSMVRLLFEVCRMLIISLMVPMEWLWSNKWVAKLDFLTFYLKSWKCSWKRFRKDRPVWPIYFILQSGHVRQYTPLCW